MKKLRFRLIHAELITRSGYRVPITVIETLGKGLLDSKRQRNTRQRFWRTIVGSIDRSIFAQKWKSTKWRERKEYRIEGNNKTEIVVLA